MRYLSVIFYSTCPLKRRGQRHDTVFVLSSSFARKGFDVEEAATGADALRLAAGKADLVLLDVNLADAINGLEVCQRLKANPTTARIPVLLVSGEAIETEHRIRGFEIGAAYDGYLDQTD